MNAHAVRCGLFLIWVAWVFGDTSEFQIKDCLHLFFMPLRKQQNNMSMRKIVLKHKVLPKQQPLLQKALLTATFAMLSSDLFAQRWRGEYDDITPTPWWLSMFIVTAFLFYLWIRKSKRLKYLEIKNETPLKVMLGQIIKCLLLDIKDNPIYTIITIATLALYTIMLLYQWAYYVFIALLCFAALGVVIYVKWSDKNDKNIN